MPEISIIIPVYKVENYLRTCLDSILRQTFNDFEVILVDDGSPDNSGKICDKYQSKDTRFKVIHKSNGGVGSARNVGLEKAEGKYIYFCDPDDYIEPDLLSDNISLLNRYHANMIVFGYYEDLNSKKRKTKYIERSPEQNIFLEDAKDFREYFQYLFNLDIMFTLWNKIYRRSYLLENGITFESVKIGEDSRFNYSVYKKIDRVYINSRKYYHYVISRTDSAVNLYKEDIFNIRYEETRRLEELVKFWGYEKKYRNMVYNDWITTLMAGVKNLYLKDCPYNDREKRNKIRQFVVTPKIAETLNEISFQNFSGSLKSKVRKQLLKRITNFFVYLMFKKFYSNK